MTKEIKQAWANRMFWRTRGCIQKPELAPPVPDVARAAEPNKKRHKWLQILLVVVLLVGCALILSACSVPGQDPPCTGSRRGEAGCANPAQGINDAPIAGEWFVDWAFQILRKILANAANFSVRVAIYLFWQIFTNLGSTDFVSCSAGGGNNPTCTTVEVFNLVRTLAFILFPAILAWKFFKSYFIGALVETAYENGVSIIGKLLIGGFALASLDVLVTGAFGLSNSLFEAILGSNQTLQDISANLLGSGQTSGVGSVDQVVNLGLLLFISFICLVVAIIFIVLGLVFFLRTILVYILFALSPLAVVAGLTEEFREWFGRWLSSVQAMLIAPIPVAICFTLVKNFTQTIPSAHDNPAEFVLQMVYVSAFLAMGAILMFKIAGQVGGLFYGLAVAGVALAAGYATGGMSLALSSLRGGSAGDGEKEEADQGQAGVGPSPSSSATSRTGSTGQAARSGSSSSTGTEASAVPNPLALGGAAGGGSAGYSSQQQFSQLVMSMRSLNESMQASMLKVSASGIAGHGEAVPFGYRTHFNMHSALAWAGREAGVNSPYLTFAPSAYGSLRGSSPGPAGSGANSLEYYNLTQQRGEGQADFGLGGNPSPVPGPVGSGGGDGIPPVSGYEETDPLQSQVNHTSSSYQVYPVYPLMASPPSLPKLPSGYIPPATGATPTGNPLAPDATGSNFDDTTSRAGSSEPSHAVSQPATPVSQSYPLLTPPPSSGSPSNFTGGSNRAKPANPDSGGSIERGDGVRISGAIPNPYGDDQPPGLPNTSGESDQKVADSEEANPS